MVLALVLVAVLVLWANTSSAEGDAMGVSGKVMAFAKAVSRQEGFPVAGSKAQRANNPGNLHAGNIGNGTIQDGSTGQITVYGSPSEGWSALYTFISETMNGEHGFSADMTLNDYGLRYSGNDPNWAPNVASMLGVSPLVRMGDLLNDSQ